MPHLWDSENSEMSFFSWLHGLFSTRNRTFKARLTYYYLCAEEDYPAPHLNNANFFLTRQGAVLGTGSPEFFHAALIEGSCRFKDGRVLTVDTLNPITWKNSTFLYGENSIGGGLVPLMSCAVDPNLVPKGSYLKIAGRTWKADDMGTGINGNHIDLFMGAGKASGQWFELRKLDQDLQTVEVLTT